jgi:hypothetical protein
MPPLMTTSGRGRLVLPFLAYWSLTHRHPNKNHLFLSPYKTFVLSLEEGKTNSNRDRKASSGALITNHLTQGQKKVETSHHEELQRKVPPRIKWGQEYQSKVKLSLCLTNEVLSHDGPWGSECIDPHLRITRGRGKQSRRFMCSKRLHSNCFIRNRTILTAVRAIHQRTRNSVFSCKGKFVEVTWW